MVNLQSRRQRREQTQAEHPVTLQGMGASQVPDRPHWGGDRRPTLLKRNDQDFLNSILAELNAGRMPRGRLTPPSQAEVLRFLQPVHRNFYVALLEVVCDPFDWSGLQARLDPRRIHSAGLVVRRLSSDGTLQGWRSEEHLASGTSLRGWMPFPDKTEEDLDPDPSYRARPLSGHPELESRLFPDASRLSESVSNLFITPPSVHEATARTLLYGLVPVTSQERSEFSQPLPAPDQDQSEALDEQIAGMLPSFLRQGKPRLLPASLRGRTLTAADTDSTDRTLLGLINEMNLLAVHFNAFDTSALMRELNQSTIHASVKESAPDKGVLNPSLLRELNKRGAEPAPDGPVPLGAFLRQVHRVLIERVPEERVRLPDRWGTITADQHARIVALIRSQLMERLSEFTAEEGRFDGVDRQYRCRAFVRLRREDGCPPRIVWSDYSNPFTIAPWYSNSDAPPIRVDLPDVLDPKVLQGLTPNVAFRVPPKVFNLLRNDPQDLLEGNDKDGADGGGIDLGWICAFNIPIITLCAFIVLNIFLQILHLIFWWLPFVKICIPFPIKKMEQPLP